MRGTHCQIGKLWQMPSVRLAINLVFDLIMLI